MKDNFKYYLIFLITIAVSSCNEEKKTAVKVIRPVKYTVVEYLDGSKNRTFTGTAENDKVRDLSFRNSGIITKFDIKLGKKVKEGQELARLDNAESRLSYGQALNQLKSAESQMNTAKLALNRIKKLYENESSSLSDFESAKDSYKTAIESYKSAKRGVEIQREQVQYGYIYAPEDGTIAAINAEIDENVSSGQVVATLNSGSKMEVALGIPESTINTIEENMEVMVSFTALDKMFQGKVTEVAPAVDSKTATYPVRVTIIEATDDIKSGMAANVTFDLTNKKASDIKMLFIPTSAVGEDSDGRFVFVIEENDSNTIVKKNRVEVGNLSSEGFEIISGLSQGQKVAIAGLQILLDGQQVKLNQ